MPRFLFVALVLLLTGKAHTAEPAVPASDRDPAPEWQLSVTPYLWGAGLEGSLEAGAVSADLDVAFSDIWDALDAGVLASFEARRGRLSITSNLVYLKLSTDAGRPVSPLLPAAPPGSFDVRYASDMLIFELRPSWEVLSLPLFGEADPRRIALDLGAGARVVWFDQHLHVELAPGVPLGPFSRRFDESTDWVDFVAVARVRASLTGRLGLVLAGDYGGFDLGSSSHRTWSLGGFLSYSLGEHWDVAAGWRSLDIERDVADFTMEGPLIGVGYRF